MFSCKSHLSWKWHFVDYEMHYDFKQSAENLHQINLNGRVYIFKRAKNLINFIFSDFINSLEKNQILEISHLFNLPYMMPLCRSNCATNTSIHAICIDLCALYRPWGIEVAMIFLHCKFPESLYSWEYYNRYPAYFGSDFSPRCTVEKRRSRIHNSSSAPCSPIGREIKFCAATICRRNHDGDSCRDFDGRGYRWKAHKELFIKPPSKLLHIYGIRLLIIRKMYLRKLKRNTFLFYMLRKMAKGLVNANIHPGYLIASVGARNISWSRLPWERQKTRSHIRSTFVTHTR